MTDAPGGGSFAPGALFAGYRIVGVLGRGGMGVVYRAEDTRLGRHVALKVLSPHVASDAGFRERFMREPRLLASIEHRNIVDVFHADQVDGVAFLAMRLIDGVDLGALLRDRRRLEPAEAAHVVGEVADALDAAHRLGLVHRDVKPANILVSAKDGPVEQARVYLTDFGLTKRNDAPSELTGTGQFVGTVDYVAPEQIQGSAIDGRADLYALACVAYECLSGRAPFQEARDAAALMAHLVTRPPDIARFRPDLPPAVGAVLMKGMAKSRDERHATCGEFAAALRSALSGTSVPLRPGGAVAPPLYVPPDAPPVARDGPPVRPPVAPPLAPSAPASEPTWAKDRTVRMVVPPVATHVSDRPAPASQPPHPYGYDAPFETQYGVARARQRAARRGQGLGGLVAGMLALLIVGGAAAAIALALANPPSASPGAAAGTRSPGARPSPTLDVAALHELLRAQIPGELRSDCTAGTPMERVLAVQECNIENGRIRLVYALYADTDSMNAAYESVRSQLGVPRDSGRAGEKCQAPATWPNEGPYTKRDVPRGRLLCTFVAGQTRFEWTDRRVDVLVSATDTSGDTRRLFRLWRDDRLPPLSAPTPQPPPSTPTPEPPAAPTEAPATPAEPMPTDPPAPVATPESP